MDTAFYNDKNYEASWQGKPHLPPLPWRPSPNYSDRAHGIVPYLIIVHRPVGGYQGSVNWLTNPASRVSSHIITEGRNTGVDSATQLVEWHKKAWAAASFNSAGYQLEMDDDAWDGDDMSAFASAARICAYLCTRTGIPPVWSHDGTRTPGVIRHFDLGRAGGGHTDPTTDEQLWRYFIKCVRKEHTRGGFRTTWGRGQLKKIT